MSDLTVKQSNLPDKIEDLSKFILVGREKLVSVRAEIRAIDKLNLAQEVREQKRSECLMLSDALLDAEVRIGELLKEIPKAKNQHDTAIHTAVSSINKPKHEVIEELGFNREQARRFETLADNKDLVEKVKAEARENDDIPTRSRVLELARQRKEEQQKPHENEMNEYEYIDFCTKAFNLFNNGILGVARVSIDPQHLGALVECFDKTITIEGELERVERAIQKLEIIRDFFKEQQKLRLVKR
jgi:hypothetical protein